MTSEKELPVSRRDTAQDDERCGRTSGSRWSRISAFLGPVLAVGCLTVLLLKPCLHAQLPSPSAAPAVERMVDVCPQTTPIVPTSSALLEELETEFTTDRFRSHAYESLGGAIRIPYVPFFSWLGPVYDFSSPGRKCTMTWASQEKIQSGIYSRSCMHT